jgi:8-oxo-dGTP pyrophosphatase MutT (NUDIX family)
MQKRDSATRQSKKGADDRVKVEISAGGIVFKRTSKGVRIAFIMDPYGKWAFAKGHVEKGEAVIDAALRETGEEMGLRKLRIIAPLGKIDFWFRDRYRAETKGVLVHKYVHYFLMQTPAGAYGKPQKTEKIRRIIWMPLGKAMATSSYDDVRPIMQRALEWFASERKRRGPRPPQPVQTRADDSPLRLTK